jgi:hypothetical protein
MLRAVGFRSRPADYWEHAVEGTSDRGIGLADAIKTLRAELVDAQRDGADSDIQFPLETMTVELRVAAVRSADGKAGFKVPLVNAELGGSAGWQRETMQTVTVVFGPPVDRAGNPVRVASQGNQVKG